jgi:hypothetical protein
MKTGKEMGRWGKDRTMTEKKKGFAAKNAQNTKKGVFNRR